MNTHSQAESYRFARWKLSILVGIAACLFPALYTLENDLQSLAQPRQFNYLRAVRSIAGQNLHSLDAIVSTYIRQLSETSVDLPVEPLRFICSASRVLSRLDRAPPPR